MIDIVGTGRFLNLYDKLGLNSLGIVVSEDMLEKARKKSAEAKLKKGNVFEIKPDFLGTELVA